MINPCELQDDIDGSKHESIIEIQSGLDSSFDQILSIDAGIKETSMPHPTDDKNSKEFKAFMRGAVSYHLHFLGDELREIYYSGGLTIVKLRKSSRVTTTSCSSPPSYRVSEISEYTAIAKESIDKFMELITSHKFINLQAHWTLEISDYDKNHQINSIHQSKDKSTPHCKSNRTCHFTCSIIYTCHEVIQIIL
jgi:hypothetical protein